MRTLDTPDAKHLIVALVHVSDVTHVIRALMRVTDSFLSYLRLQVTKAGEVGSGEQRPDVDPGLLHQLDPHPDVPGLPLEVWVRAGGQDKSENNKTKY